MSTCCLQNRETGRFFGWFAKRYRRRFVRKGLEPSQKHLIKGLGKVGFSGARLLEIGCGTGYLHQQLLRSGADSAVGIDLSARMLEEARAEARAHGLAERTEYREGDFVELAEGLGRADIVILDKVICCYPRLLLTVLRCGFRSYVHDVTAIDRWLRDAGLVQVFEERTPVWLTRVYTRG
jgi:magnesium-protoporphyrin O-methyltransferase